MNNFFQLFKQIIWLFMFSILKKLNDSTIGFTVSDNFSEFWEVPSEPFFDSHGKGIQIFVHLFNNGNRLNYVFILSIHIKLYIISRERVCKTEFSSD